MDPILRATPFRKLTALFCRLPLPTFLYWPEVTNLGILMRLSVRSGMSMCMVPLIFMGYLLEQRIHNIIRHSSIFLTFNSPIDLFLWSCIACETSQHQSFVNKILLPHQQTNAFPFHSRQSSFTLHKGKANGHLLY